MTCKDCIHYTVCEHHADELRAEGYIVDFNNRSDAEKVCEGYKQKSGWISVEDRLPEKEGVYLVHTTYNIIETEVFYISKHDDISYWWDLDGMVTHWMPLPEPPKMKGGAE